jgi:hypothetical protein
VEGIMVASDTSYPRLVIRTRRASAVLLFAQFLAVLALLVARLAAAGAPALEWVTLSLYAALPVMATLRILTLLQKLELGSGASDEVRLALFDTSLILPAVGYLPLLFALFRL